MASVNASAWRVLGASVRGAMHLREGIPNQDAFALHQDHTEPTITIAALADGHGGARHFRSEQGARFAAQTGVAVLRAMAPRIDATNNAADRQLIVEAIPARIVAEWRALAFAHLERHALTEDELAQATRIEGAAASAMVRADPLIAYGATCLVALATERVLLLAQIGDGDILAVTRDGETLRPISHDARLVGNLTTSLCMGSAVGDFRTTCYALDAGLDTRAPDLVLLATDGYANSFRTDADFRLVARDFATMIEARGIDRVAGELDSILRDASDHGSGDDVTLALLSRLHGSQRDRS